MIFESKFGLGEIVIHRVNLRNDIVNEEMYEVCGITFQKGVEPVVAVRNPKDGMHRIFLESELIGDPDFDQIAGYPEE
jgi:hypothetical protein